jgi:hypothetical protein
MHPKLVSEETRVGGPLASADQVALDFAEIAPARDVLHYFPRVLTQRFAPRGEHGGPETLGMGLESFGDRLERFLRTATPNVAKSLSENGEGFCLGGKGSIGKARGGSRPAAVCDRQATPPAGPSLPNPPGGGSFRLGLRWFGRNRPQEVCPAAHRLAQPRIPQPQNPSAFSDRL